MTKEMILYKNGEGRILAHRKGILANNPLLRSKNTIENDYGINQYHQTTYNRLFECLRKRINRKNKIIYIGLDGRVLTIDTVTFHEFDSKVEREIIHIDEELIADPYFVEALHEMVLDYFEVKEETDRNTANANRSMVHRQYIKNLAEATIVNFDKTGAIEEFEDAQIVEEVYKMIQTHGVEFAENLVRRVNEANAQNLSRFGVCTIVGSAVSSILYGAIKGNVNDAISYASGALTVCVAVNIAALIKNNQERKRMVRTLLDRMQEEYQIGSDGKVNVDIPVLEEPSRLHL